VSAAGPSASSCASSEIVIVLPLNVIPPAVPDGSLVETTTPELTVIVSAFASSYAPIRWTSPVKVIEPPLMVSLLVMALSA
jgi:hypothetical protein